MKVPFGIFLYALFDNLHSNMDRFERPVFCFNQCTDLNLHSNMDRFERNELYYNRSGRNHLHSNMDRFERNIILSVIAERDGIYIPIWIDLKVLLSDIIKFLLFLFTFQYG